MQTTTANEDKTAESIVREGVDGTLINLAEHRRSVNDRFPDVEDLMDRLTDGVFDVANSAGRS